MDDGVDGNQLAGLPGDRPTDGLQTLSLFYNLLAAFLESIVALTNPEVLELDTNSLARPFRAIRRVQAWHQALEDSLTCSVCSNDCLGSLVLEVPRL
jgi:hypothetical protein